MFVASFPLRRYGRCNSIWLYTSNNSPVNFDCRLLLHRAPIKIPFESTRTVPFKWWSILPWGKDIMYCCSDTREQNLSCDPHDIVGESLNWLTGNDWLGLELGRWDISWCDSGGSQIVVKKSFREAFLIGVVGSTKVIMVQCLNDERLNPSAAMSFKDIFLTGKVVRNLLSIRLGSVRFSGIQQIWVFFPGTSCNIPSRRLLLIQWLRRSTWPILPALSISLMQSLHFLSLKWFRFCENLLCGSDLEHVEQLLLGWHS